MTDPSAPTTRRRRRRWPWVLAVLAVLLAGGAWWIDRQLEPQRLTALVLGRLGPALGLELSIDGMPEYALRPEPRLVLPNLVARQPGAATPLLRAVRAEVSLPWDTILGEGPVVITRVELDEPVLDLAALSAWQAARPATPFELPTLTRGLHVNAGTVVGAGWTLSALMLDVPELRPGAPASASMAGLFERPGTSVDFTGDIQLEKAGLTSAIDLRAEGRVRSGELDAPYAIALNGNLDAAGDIIVLDAATLTLRSESPVPNLTATGNASLGDRITASLAGEIAEWPTAWPVLPEPLSSSTSPLAWSLDYDGAADLSAPLSLQLVRDETRLDTRVVVGELTAWLDRPDASPLPPLQGSLETPTLVVGGATLEGIRITVEEENDAPVEDAGSQVQP